MKVALVSAVVVVLAAALLVFALAPSGKPPAMEAGWTAIRDDALAKAYAPAISCPERFGKIVAVYYRAARSPDGILRIAYHPVWESESNPAGGIGPFLSRILYTGGLSLQGIMFGPGDVEAIAIEVGPDGIAREAQFERAKGYSDKDFSVIHEKAREALIGLSARGLRPSFETASWNHLFVMRETIGAVPSVGRATAGPGFAEPGYEPRYFEPALWKSYGMTKNPPTRLFRHRAHFPWEIAAAPGQ